MNTKKVIVTCCVALLYLASIGSVRAFSPQPGTADDPLVSVSYLTQVVQPILDRIAALEAQLLALPAVPVPGTSMTTVIGQRGYTVAGVKTDFAPVIYNNNGDTVMPLRMLEALGAVANWNEATQTATLSFSGKTVSVTIGQSVAVVNGQAIPLIGASGKPAPAHLVPGRTMIPTRFVSEQLGLRVDWSPPNNLTITTPAR